MPTLNQRGVVHIALILLLLAGLVAGVYLVQQQQIFRPKASGGKVWLIDDSGNNVPQKDGGVYEVPGQQIRIFIHQPTVWSPPQPQGRLPNLVTAAYAQQSGQCGNTWSGQPTQCADSSGKTAGGTQCSGPYLGAYTGCSGNTLYCYSCPGTTTGGTGSSGTTTNTGITADVSTPTITGASWDQEGSYLTITGSGFGNSQGTVYYSRGGSEQFPSYSVNSWGAGSVKIGAEIPLGATKSVENMISGGNYLKVCRADGKCSAYWSPIPERPKFRIDIPTASKDAPQGQGASAAPTQQPEVTEATAEIRISSVVDYVKKDGACEGSEDPAKHCMSLTEDNPDSRYTFAALLTKGYVSWWLANTTEEQNVFVGFISNKDTNSVESIRVSIVRAQPTPQPTGSGASPGQVSPASALDRLVGATDVSCIDGTAYQYPIGSDGVDTGYGCVCKENDRNLNVVFITDKETGQDLVETGSSCKPTLSVSPTPPPGGRGGLRRDEGELSGIKPSCLQSDGTCVDETFHTADRQICTRGFSQSRDYDCPPAYPTCIFGADCREVPTPTPTPSVTARPSCLQSDGTCVDETFHTADRQICTRGFSQSRDYDCPPAYPTCIFGADCREVPTPTPTPAGTGSPGSPVAGKIYVQNNKDQQVAIQKVELESGSFLWWPTFTQLISNRTLNSNGYVPVPVTSGICSSSDNATGKKKEVKVEYTDTEVIDPTIGTITRVATGKYQCGGSGTVTIP